MIKIEKLSKSYIHSKSKNINNILNNISLDLPEKGLIFLLGKSGSGKTTLLHLLGCLDVIDQGDILVHNNSVRSFKYVDYDNYRNGNISFVFQDYNLISDLTVEKNITLSLELQGKKADFSLVRKILRSVDLVGFEKRFINELSGGQQQRVAIARALIKDTNFILCDEPTGNLDSETSEKIFKLFKEMSKNKLILIVTHDIESAFSFGDRVIEMKDGKIISDLSKDYNLEKEKQTDSLNNLKGQVITEELLKKISQSSSLDNYKKMFIPTNQNINNYETKSLKKISSHLPLSLSLKMGTSFFKKKKFSLFINILNSIFLYQIWLFLALLSIIMNCTKNVFFKFYPNFSSNVVDNYFTKSIRQFNIGLFFLVFVILFISSFTIGGFVKKTIIFKKKDIGILRALGARRIDIFKIFFTEGFVISLLITFLLSIIIFIPEPRINWTRILNIKSESFEKFIKDFISRIKDDFNINDNSDLNIWFESLKKEYKFWSNEFLLILFIFVFNLIVVFLSTFLPIYKFAKKKVIEVILDK
ncbi:MAG: ATP-binding cassette domain-containing protein [Candidatus Phytoplasma stylosanthis]|uniref:ABC transporter ATP-binding protein/permease n=1 Tax=Candidatus Phytoplasma stylosanthis TaxID=2798314 RepID=UPI00293A5778|nr:ATP-binding cassette domain-containing protein [Candidatus Phytoplasma stylosanthis]MDV3167776.1 ATP-binding cassette domain-containing protein [Candidatus Phytoplasma stylosanthis]MDV3170947.1 ATP-binding cassette domain-containing protein [Candidatus Phytoplasma stylosanthis]MDV3173540.1 ATP-binding cassette domain-containing protein [Candidatus Phytoplasma stylosanthis]MDV3174119.1 ATP-binding cassette domain-containing protein [Candidatus Phytoplasma stylosanthis]MDV3202361.1 ATP-bindin